MGFSRFSQILLYSVFGLCMTLFFMTVFFSYKCVEMSKLRNPYILDSIPPDISCLYDCLAKGDVHKELIRHFPPVTVHYMWCYKTQFEYKHYFSVLSVVKLLQPDQIILHYLEMPKAERNGYFTWFEDIQRQVPMLSLKQVKDVKHCSHTFLQGLQNSQEFSNTGGIFIMDDIVLTNLTRDIFYHLTDVSEKNDASRRKANRMSTQLFLVPEYEFLGVPLPDNVTLLQCPSVTSFRKGSAHFCVHLNQHFFPSDFLLENVSFYSFARPIAYNTLTPLVPTSTTYIETQRIVHVLNLNRDSLDPLCFLSIKSAFVLGAVDHVFLHSQTFFRTSLWHKLLQDHSVRYVYAPELGSTPFGQLLYGVYTLAQHGGMIMTCDVIFLKHSGFLFDYPAVTTVQKSSNRLVHHNQLDFTILFAKPNSLFLKTLLPVMKQVSYASLEVDAGSVGYHVYEQYPSAVYLERNLLYQQICTINICHSAPGEANVGQSFFTKLSWLPDIGRISLEQISSLKMIPGSVVHHILRNSQLKL